MNKETNHITTDQLHAYLDQNLDQTKHQEIKIHLDRCPSCQEELSRLEIIFARLENLPPLELEKDLSLPVLAQLREETKLSLGITWTLVLEALGA